MTNFRAPMMTSLRIRIRCFSAMSRLVWVRAVSAAVSEASRPVASKALKSPRNPRISLVMSAKVSRTLICTPITARKIWTIMLTRSPMIGT